MSKLLTISLLVFLNESFAQTIRDDKGFTMLLGPSVNIYYGDTRNSFSYSSPRLSWQFNGQVGFISTRGGTHRGNMIGLFASVGSLKPEMIELMKEGGAELPDNLNPGKKFNEFYCVEGGMIIARFLRMSAGFGAQAYTYDTDQHAMLKYFSATAGVAFNLGVVNWVVDAQVMAGKNMNQNAVRLSTGFMVKF